MEKVICQECQKEFDTESSLHKHLKAHKLLLAEYYQKYFPRKDKYDGAIIKFRNKEQYFTTDFNSRENMKFWINKSSPDKVREYMKGLLEFRKKKKNLTMAPSQVELRTAMLPPIQCYDLFFQGYSKLCGELGLQPRFKKGPYEFKTHTGIVENGSSPYVIYIDTREQKPLDFESHQSEIKTLKFGDYACSSHDVSCRCYVERKSPQDFIGTFSGGYERFCRELDRAVEAGAYMVVLCEDTLSNMIQFDKLPYIYHKNASVNPEFIFHNVRTIIQKYSNCQFLFVDGRWKAAKTIETIFNSKCTYKDVDLQLVYDLGLI